MSDAVSAAPSAPAASAPATQAPAASNTKGPAQTTPQSQGKEGAPAPQPQSEPQAEEFEEVKIGSSSAKVPKAFAKTIKDLERGFHSKAQEAAYIRQEAQKFMAQAKENPDLFFKQTGIDPDQYSQARLQKMIEQQMMSPEQKELARLREEKAQYERQVKEHQERQARERQTAEEQKTSLQMRNELVEALKGSSIDAEGMTKGELSYFAARVVAVKASAEEQKLDWTWQQCVARVEQDLERSERARVSKMDPEMLEKRYGREALDRWRDYDVKRVTGSSATSPQAQQRNRPGESPASTQDKSGAKKALSESEYRDYFARIAKG